VTSKSSALSRGTVSKKSRPKIGTKSRAFRFHQYLGPKNLQQQLEPCASSSSLTAADTLSPFDILVAQHQTLLRWQLEAQQKNSGFLIEGPSNKPPQSATPRVAVSTPALQTTSINVAVKPSASVAAVNPELAAKRNQLEEKKVAELKDECRRLNLPVSGSKPVLIDRLLPYADDILSSGGVTAASDISKPLEQFATSAASAGAAAAFGVSNNDANSATNMMFNMQQPPSMMTAENGISSAATCRSTSAVPMDVDGVLCKQEPQTPDVAQPNVYPMMLLPTSNDGNVVQASVSSAVPPLIVFRPTVQPVMRTPANVPRPIASMPPFLQQQMLLQQQRHINELERHLQLSQQELVRAKQEAHLQQINLLRSNASLWVNDAALNGSSVSASMSSANLRAAAPQLQRTNRCVRLFVSVRSQNNSEFS